MTEVIVWVMVDENGSYIACLAREELAQNHDDVHNTREDGLATRVLCLKVNVPTPAALELSATVGPEAAGGVLTVAATSRELS